MYKIHEYLARELLFRILMYFLHDEYKGEWREWWPVEEKL
jgi:hypothetical protein